MALYRVFLAVNAIALAGLLAGCAFTENRSVEVLPEHLQCQTDADCTEVPLACLSCGDVVAKKFASQLSAERSLLCRRYRGPIADCNPSPGVICKSGQCVGAPYIWEERK
jgi:hypothetical protein